MHRRQPLPRLWMMTDERQGDRLWHALAALPRGAGLVFRHYSVPGPARRALFRHVKAIARRKGLLLLLAGRPQLARAWGADGSYGEGGRPVPGLVRAAAAHDLRELRRAERAGAHLMFVSPVFPTRSHPQARPLGRLRFRLLARQARGPVIALGGMSRARARGLRDSPMHGWAAIDAWTRGGN